MQVVLAHESTTSCVGFHGSEDIIVRNWAVGFIAVKHLLCLEKTAICNTILWLDWFSARLKVFRQGITTCCYYCLATQCNTNATAYSRIPHGTVPCKALRCRPYILYVLQCWHNDTWQVCGFTINYWWPLWLFVILGRSLISSWFCFYKVMHLEAVADL